MAFDPYRQGLPVIHTQSSWVKRFPWRDGGSQLFNYQFLASIGIDPAPPRWPLQPNDLSRFVVYWAGPNQVLQMPATNPNVDLYKGITMNPQFINGFEEVVEKNAILMMPVGSEAVVHGDYVQPDRNSVFATQDLDVVPQRFKKQWIKAIGTTVTAAVNLLAGYAVGSTVIEIDTIAAAFSLMAGQTIMITTGGVGSYYLIKSIAYIAGTAGAGAFITLAWGVTTALINNDVITNVHAANAPMYFEWDTEFYENLLSIESRFHVTGAGAAVYAPIAAFAAGGIGATNVAIVPSGAGGVALFTHPGGARGGIGLQLGTIVNAGDILILTAYFYDKHIRQRTIGYAEQSGAARTAATAATEIRVELK
jgi:hypothetical protein